MVSFNEDPEQYKSSEMVEHIDSSIQRYVPFIFYRILYVIYKVVHAPRFLKFIIFLGT